MKSTQKMNLAKASDMLAEASNLVYKSLDFTPRDKDVFDRESHVRLSGHIIADILEMQCNLWELDFELVPEYLRPSLEHGDLTMAIEGMASGHEILEQQGIRVMELHMPNDVFKEFEKEATIGGKYRMAKAWWEKQDKPHIPVHRMAHFFFHEHQHMRYHAAKEIEKRYGVVLWNDETNSLDDEAVKNWLQSENIKLNIKKPWA